MKSTCISLLLLFCSLNSHAQKYIVSVPNPEVKCAEGHVPSLPYRVMVQYSDGSSGFRQVRWTGSSRDAEMYMADPRFNPEGTTYTVRGFVTGDNSTPDGYPIEARVEVTARQAQDKSVVAEPLPLSAVRLKGDNRLTSNRDMAIREILSWDVRQQLYNYRDTYGLPTEGYPRSDGWDSPGTKLKGHGTGHYMSALAFAYSSCGNDSLKAMILDRVRVLLDGLRECQERTFVFDESLGRYREARDYAPEEKLRQMKGSWEDFDRYKQDYANYGYGYLNAIPAAHCALIEMYRPYNNSDWVWAPYYSVHKQLAGLVDIALNIDDKQLSDKAFIIARDMGMWVWNRLHYRTFVQRDGSREERRARPGNRYEMWNMYIAGEVGGMQESLSRLSEMSSDPEDKARLLEAARFFDSPAFYDPLSVNIDDIRTRHANQHIPMVTGALRSYRSDADPYYYELSQNFWHLVQGRYRYAAGGVGNGEMFREPYSQIANMASYNPNINETCCAYNLAKLTKELNCFNPDDASYMDYYERVLYNQIVGSLHPHRYMTTYQYAVGLNASKPWGNTTPQSSCCGGTGSENHVKYQEAAYFVSDDTIWIGLYMPTEALWEAKGVMLEQECSWPAERSRIRVSKGSARFAMKLRVPYWATEGFDVKLNGRSLAEHYQPGTYVEIPRRRWSRRDVVEVVMPFAAHIDFGPDKMLVGESAMWAGAFMYGPLVMGTQGISDWSEAQLKLRADLSEVRLCGASQDGGTQGNLYTLEIGGRVFYPDYWLDRNATRYFAIDLCSETDPGFAAVGYSASAEAERRLNELRQVAAMRIADRSQWAPHSFARMLSVYEDMAADEATLSMALNAMRPSHLAEPEDLEPLRLLLAMAPDSLAQAREYAEMVIRYVTDGSGTHDMIHRAEEGLKDAGFDVYLLIGQSNMAGRGVLRQQDTLSLEDGVYLLDGNGVPVPAKAPLNRYSTIRKDMRVQGENPARAFASAMREHNGRPVLLVVNARGGTSISSWLKDAAPSGGRPQYYSEAVRRASEAMRYGRLKGILWHQGESDSDSTRAAVYMQRLVRLVADLRTDLGVGESVPFVAGEILRSHDNASVFNPVIGRIADYIPNSACVSSEGLAPLPDNLHFDRESQLVLGGRYAEAIISLYGYR